MFRILTAAYQEGKTGADARAFEPRPVRCGRVLVPLSRDVPVRHRHSNPIGTLGRMFNERVFTI